MADLTVSAAVDTFLASANQAAMRTNMGTVRTLTFGWDSPANGNVSFPVVATFAGTITGYKLLIPGVTGSVTVEVWKAASAIPTVANKISAAAPATGSAAFTSSTTLTGWTTSVAVNDVFKCSLTDADTASPIVLQLTILEA